jgi:hypothetical protein
MKFFVAAALLSFSVGALATPVKTCNTTLSMPGETPVPTKMEILEVDGKLIAKITQKVDGQTSSYEDTAAMADYSVRAGLTETVNPEGLNPAEILIVHAMTLENDPVFEGKIRSGVALKKVRGAKVYTVGEVTNMGGTAIVEARDAKNKALGSYLGGFLVTPCK